MHRMTGITIVMLALTGNAWASASDACWQRFQAKKIKTAIGLAQCTNKAQYAELRAATHHHDLVRYLEAQRLAIAEKVDRGEISFAAFVAEFQAVSAGVNSEIQKRNAMSAPPAAAQQPAARGMVICNTFGSSTMCF